MELVALPAFTDNCIWMLHDGSRALMVDTGNASMVVQACEPRRPPLATILVRRHGADHAGDVDALQPDLRFAPVVEPGNRDIVARRCRCGDERLRERTALAPTIGRGRAALHERKNRYR